jgi:hypothetical protein
MKGRAHVSLGMDASGGFELLVEIEEAIIISHDSRVDLELLQGLDLAAIGDLGSHHDRFDPLANAVLENTRAYAHIKTGKFHVDQISGRVHMNIHIAISDPAAQRIDEFTVEILQSLSSARPDYGMSDEIRKHCAPFL